MSLQHHDKPGRVTDKLARLRHWARRIRQETHAVFLAARDPRVAWPVRLLALAVAAYALSPIDLIPDAIPVLGLLDDAIIVPLGILLVVRLLPPEILAEHRRAVAQQAGKPTSRLGALLVVALWLLAAAILMRILWPYLVD
jgi:uncharacterized membrane protein YkvA (DUF1232 family)